MKNRILSIALAFAMFFTLMPAGAIALHRAAAAPLSEDDGGVPPPSDETPGEESDDEETEDEEGEGGEDEDPEGEDPGDEEGGDGEEEIGFLLSDHLDYTHPTHLNEGSVSLSECFNKNLSPGLMSFTKGEAVTEGSVKLESWSVDNDALVRFQLSNAKEGDTITLPITVNSQRYGSALLNLVITIGYQDLMIICDTTVIYGNTIKLSCVGLKGTGAVIYTITDGAHRATISADVLTALKTGTVTIKAVQVPDGTPDAPQARESQSVTITIEKATPSVTADSASLQRAGQTLADAVLTIKSSSVDGRIEWVLPDSTIVLANTAYEWIFTPTDYENYRSVTGTLTPYVVLDEDFVIGSGTTVQNDDGSYTTVSYGEDDSRYELTEYPDGRLCMVHYQLDGTVVTTDKEADGTRTLTTEKKDGSLRIESYLSSGLTYCTTEDPYGRVDIQISLPYHLTDAAAKNGTVFELPIPDLPNTDNRADAPTIVFTISTRSPVRVSIPINNPSAGTVAILVDKNGGETVVKTSITGRDALLVTLSGSTAVKIVDAAKRFKDVSGSDWFRGAADFVTSRGLFQGVDAVSFAPYETMSRAMLVQVLHNLEGNPWYGMYPFYSDIAGTWYAESASWATYCGYINGFPDGKFHGDEDITREQLAAILYRYVGSPSVSEFVNTTIYDYHDYADINSYAWTAMYWAVNSGVLYTDGSTHLSPRHEVSRAEVAQTFRNLVEYLTR